jgi:hypothetical protein
MINIFYNYYQNGPRKVIDNLCKGFSQNSIEFSTNHKLYQNSIYLSTNSDIIIDNTQHTILGPNIWFEDRIVLEQNYKYFIVPSDWVRDLILKSVPISENKVLVWQVGIDTDYFPDMKENPKDLDCFIYFKNRENRELQRIKDFLFDKKLRFEIIYYGQYKENEFLDLIRRSKFSIILGNTESQGIAIQEIMSSNLPLFVWNKTYWSNEKYSCKSTTVPYWDENCGVVFESESELEVRFDFFLNNLANFNPREFVIRELNLSEQAKKLINLF